jgi:hypothetical protein
MSSLLPLPSSLTRRAFLGRSAAGLGSLALGLLLQPRLFGAAGNDRWAGVVQPLHHPAKVKRVIVPQSGRWAVAP